MHFVLFQYFFYMQMQPRVQVIPFLKSDKEVFVKTLILLMVVQ